MKNITLSAAERLIEKARRTARKRVQTMYRFFSRLAEELSPDRNILREFDQLMRDVDESGVKAGRTFTREEMNAP